MKIIRYHNSPRYQASGYPNLRAEMDRLFDVAFPALSSPQRDFPLDLYQGKDAFVVRAELPGFRKEDLNLAVADGVLTLTAHQKTEAKSGEKDSRATTQERQFSRSVTLPEHLQLDQIAAAYENGVLTVTLPKSEAVKPRQIAITVK